MARTLRFPRCPSRTPFTRLPSRPPLLPLLLPPLLASVVWSCCLRCSACCSEGGRTGVVVKISLWMCGACLAWGDSVQAAGALASRLAPGLWLGLGTGMGTGPVPPLC